jgi:uncharacterized repeat protein (TIGR01451 family)
MSAHLVSDPKLAIRFMTRASRFTLVLIAAILLGTALFSASSAHKTNGNRVDSASASPDAKTFVGQRNSARLISKFQGGNAGTEAPALFGALLPQGPPAPEIIATYAADCMTAKSSFVFGEHACAILSGGPPLSIYPRKITWVDPDNNILQTENVTTDPQTSHFTIPAFSTSTDYRGVWRVNDISASRSSVRTSAFFNVSNPAQPAADLSVFKGNDTDSTITAGSNIAYVLWLSNKGPDAASKVQFTDATPANTTFLSPGITDEPNLHCTFPADNSAGGTTTCTMDSLAPGASAKLTLTMNVNSGTSAGTIISNTANISSDTPDPHDASNTPPPPDPNSDPSNNTATSRVTVVASGGGGTTCSFDCPTNIVATANTTVGGLFGAFVSYPSATGINGDCGAISANPASGSFYTVGTFTVVVTSDAGPGCSFKVTVSDTPEPTISCPSDKIVTAGPGGTFTFPAGGVGTPTTTGTGVTVTFLRSDNLPATFDGDGNVIDPPVIHTLTDPFPTGTTGITWTVVDSIGRTASCEQKIIVHAPCASDKLPPTITAPRDISVGTGPNSTTCGAVLDDELGTATAQDDCSAVVTSTGIPAGNLFPIGTTTITYTATDGSGHTASAVQHVTVTDNTPPVIFAPANASYVCPSDVPAANIAQAHGPDIIVNGVAQPGPVFDNCGIATVTVSQTSAGAGSAASPLVITRTYTATDIHGNSASAVQVITVIDPTPPTFTFVPPTVTAYTGPGATTCDTVVDPGQATATDNCGSVTVTRSPSGNTFAVGNTTITWTATDAAGNQSTATQTVTVIDNTPPVITTNGQTLSMWPPNHKYQTFGVTNFVTGASDNCGGVSIGDVVIAKVTSDEVENGPGSGNTLNDIVIAPDCKSVQLRAEREGGGDGRVYTIFFSVSDSAGNVGTATVKVVVPHNTGETPVDSGPHYTVFCGGL